MRYIDLFGGIGGFRHGIEKATQNVGCIQQKNKGRVSDSNRSMPQFNKGNRRWKCVWYCDNDKYAVQTYNKNFKENYEPTDITKVKTRDIPDFDVLCGGFPCQSFSIAGKRRGFKDTRGTMFFEIARIVKAKRPSYLFLENVKRLLNHNKGETFRTILQTLDELGYNYQWMVLNSKFFGVPQNRERIFIIANLRGKSKPKILSFRENAAEIPGVSEDKGEWQMRIGHTKSEYAPLQYQSPITRTLEANGSLSVYTQERKEMRTHKGESPTLKQRMGTGGNNVPMVTGMLPITAKKRRFETPKEINEYLKKHKGDYTIKEISEYIEIPKTQVEHYFRTDKSRAIPDILTWFALKKLLGFDETWDTEVATFYEKEVEFEMQRRVYSEKGLSPTLKTDVPMVAGTLTGGGHSGGLHSDMTVIQEKRKVGYDIANCVTPDAYLMKGERKRVNGKAVLTSAHERRLRRLTPIECERLQGFPDNWTEGVSDTQRYKQLGNAVTTNVITAIVESWIK